MQVSDCHEEDSDLFLFPTKYEGFGTVVIEAQMTNLPIIAGDTIPHETKLCDCVKFMSIKENPIVWAKEAVKMAKDTKRKNNISLLQESGYDITEQYHWMENFYIEHVDKKNI